MPSLSETLRQCRLVSTGRPAKCSGHVSRKAGAQFTIRGMSGKNEMGKTEMELVKNQEAEMVFSMQQLDSSSLEALKRLDWYHCPTTAERKWIEPIARMAEPPHRPAPPEKLTSVILALSAALPKQATDEMRGETMLAVYQRQLANLTIEELEQSARKCLDELDWFPTIHQIKDRALNAAGQRISTDEQILHSKARAIVRSKPPVQEVREEAKPLSPEEQARVEAETKSIIAELTAKAKGERQIL